MRKTSKGSRHNKALQGLAISSASLLMLSSRVKISRLIPIVASFLFVIFNPLFIPLTQAVTTSHSLQTPHLEASLISRSNYVIPGQTLELALRLVPEEGWHTYWKNPGDTGLPTQIHWTLPKGFKAGDIEWPVPERIDYQELINFGYHGETWLLVPIAVPHVLSANQVTIAAKGKWLVCREVCIPAEAEFQLTLPVVEAGNKAFQVNQSLKGEWESAFISAWQKLPQFVETASAEFKVNTDFEAHIDMQSLPEFNSRPEVFIGARGLVSNTIKPAVAIGEDKLVITAKSDPYLEEIPRFVSLSIVTEQNGHTKALDILAEHKPELVSLAANLSSQAAVLANKASLPDSQKTMNLALVLLFALLGGFILNAMPCVFPVLSLKIISLVESGNHSTTERHRHGLAYTAGVVLSFVLVAVVLIVLRGFGEQVGWGFQLQSPLFVGGLVYVLFLLGLSMSGVVEIGSALQNVGSGLTQGQDENDWRKSFFTGVLATVVATPCTAPFMGTAMGVALSQPIYISLLIFSVMGLGLALPFLLIAYIPALANALPSPGNWMVRLKEVLAFPLYLTAVWLLWVFARQVGTDATAALLVGLVLLSFAAWLWRVTLYQNKAVYFQVISGFAVALAIGMLAVGVRVAYVPNSEQKQKADAYYSKFSNTSLKAALSEGQTVFVNMTADWCITCKVNERVALATDTVKTLFKEQDVTYLKGDWTNSDAEITQYLESFNRSGVPLYVVYKKGVEPEVLPQILTPDIVVKAIKGNR